ncbi:MAG: type IV pilus assembly protein PilM [Microgenomates group bacterium Gr01-1014_5]|nr:MAG: type IV pilus assembly protein PilM [Microgenomates group bacterium Gr01-1014_5]
MPAFGLDIGTTSIKAVQLDKQGENFSLLAAGITPTPTRGMETENQKDLEAVAVAVKKLITDTKITSRDVAISLPESKVYTRLISLPLLTDEEVSSAIAWQAEPYIPIPVAEASLDYQIVGRTEAVQGKPGKTDVLLIAASKALIKQYLDVCSIAGLNVVHVMSELLALTSALATDKQTVLLADIGSTSTDFAIVRSGQLLVSRSVATGGNVLTRAVSAGLSVDTQRAEEYKKSYGLNASFLEGRVKASVEPAFRVIVEEAKKTIQYYRSEIGRDDQVSSMILSGGTAGIPDSTSYIANALGIEVLVGDPFAGIAKNEQTAKSLASWAPLYGISVGLAKYSYT